MKSPTSTYELIARTTRSGIVESQHFGAVVALNQDGSIAFAVGDPDVATVLLDEGRPEYLGGQFVATVVASMDWEALTEVFRTGVPVRSRPIGRAHV